MSDQQETKSGKTLGLSKKIELDKVIDAENIRQSISKSGKKTVMVEVRRRRVPQDKIKPPLPEEPPKIEEMVVVEKTLNNAEATDASQEGRQTKLTNIEREGRLKALKLALKAQAEEKKRLEVELKKQKELEEKKALLPQDTESLETSSSILQPQAEEHPKSRKDTEALNAPAIDLSHDVEQKASLKKKKKSHLDETGDDEEFANKFRPVRKKLEKGRTTREEENTFTRGHNIAIQDILAEEEDDKKEEIVNESFEAPPKVKSPVGLHRFKAKKKVKQPIATQKIIREVVIPEVITVQELANRMAVRVAEVIKSLVKMGMMVTINQTIDADTAELIILEFGHKVKRVAEADIEQGLGIGEDNSTNLRPRPPVVTIMGHVDHGKTSLLDALRETNVVAKEAGGITQHIGAYKITLATNQEITFIDTPGHAAFTKMRARGANVTDIVVLVVAADDGIKEQTIEAISHAKAAGVPIIIAINKMDKRDADPSRVRTELLQHGIVVEAMGGDVLDVEISALKKMNLDKLEEAILLQSEILELKANLECKACGTVIETKMEQGRGLVTTALIQRGTLKMGDIYVCGSAWGRVRALIDDQGCTIEKATPSTPIAILGTTGIVTAGDDFYVVESELRARKIAEYREQKKKKQAQTRPAASVETLMTAFEAEKVKELALIIKADVHGSVEAIRASVENIKSDEVKVKVLHAAVGDITESDVVLAQASHAKIIAFNVRVNPQAQEIAQREKIFIHSYSIIYELIDNVKAFVAGMGEPIVREKSLGNATVREVFNIGKTGRIAGCYVQNGYIKRGTIARLLREDKVIHEGKIKSLRRFKDEVKEVKEGYECGISFESYQDIMVGDVIECLELEEIAPSIDKL